MAKKAFFTNADHSSAGGFKAWVTDLTTALDEIGFIRSADTGQFDVAAISSVPALGTSPLYEIRYLNDALHAVAPIYVRLEYGTRGTATPYVGVTVGTGTDGAGGITGVFGSFGPQRVTTTVSGTGAPPYQCYACMVEGAVWFSFADLRMGAGTTSHPALFSLVIARTTDATGAPTSDGAAAYFTRQAWDNFSPSTRSFKNAWGAAAGGYTGSGSRGFGGNDTANTGLPWAFAPMNITSSSDSEGRKQVIPHILPFPELRVMQQIASILPGDGIAHGTQFEAALVGAEPRNYIVVSGARNHTVERFALIWE